MEEPLKQALETIEVPQNSLKLTQNERRSIIDEKVRSMILRGKSRPACLKFISDESKRLGFENTESHCSNIYHQCKSSIKNELEEVRDELFTDISAKLYHLYEKNYEKEDLREARECLKEIARLAGIGGNQLNIAKKDDTEIINIQFN